MRKPDESVTVFTLRRIRNEMIEECEKAIADIISDPDYRDDGDDAWYDGVTAALTAIGRLKA